MSVSGKKKLFGILNLLLIAAVFIGNYFYLSDDYSLLKKALCSSGFALLGLGNLLYAILLRSNRLRFAVSMAAGLVFCMLGDIVLHYDFIFGALLFACGHVFYAVAYCFSQKFKATDLIPSAVLFLASASFILFSPDLVFDAPVMRYVCVGYALVISVMAGKAVANACRAKDGFHLLLAVGSLLFVFSDLMLLLDMFMGMGRLSGLLCMSTYYPAQCLLAFSVYCRESR